LCKDGSLVWLENRIQRVTWKDTPAVLSANVDISERKAIEEQLRQAQKMEAVGQLTGGVAHDFNNLLSVILGNLDLLRENLDENDPAHDNIDAAFAAGQRGAGLTQRLLAFSRQQALDPQPINLNELISEMTDLLRRSLGETIDIETVIAGDLWICEADRTQLENALLNLAVNARDAMTGRDLADAAHRGQPALKVLYMSGYTSNAIVHDGRLDADARLLQKPFRKEDLARKLRAVLDSE
jgi:signal transduction histidine kinase